MLRVENLCFKAGKFALQNVSIEVAEGEYFALLGPTGSGKSLLVQAVCGLIRPDSGEIFIGGRNVTALAPRLRGIGYVPQDYSLFPHLDVERNICFGLLARGMTMQQARQSIGSLVETLQLGHLLRRSTTSLSGGERQKVALARALAIKPKLLMLDEPVSALDESIRQSVCAELIRIQRQLRIATIHVTHSFEEALTVSDRAGIMRAGRIAQTGPMRELMRRPADEDIARFLRMENIYRGAAAGPSSDGTLVAVQGCELAVPGRWQGEIAFMIRPADVEVAPLSQQANRAEANTLEGELKGIAERGAYNRLEFDAGIRVFAYAIASRAGYDFRIGQRYTIRLPAEAIHVFPA